MSSTKRIWKPLDVGGLRLYKVEQMIQYRDGHFDSRILLAVARSPKNAELLVHECYRNTKWNAEIVTVNYYGKAIDVLMPESWWQDGVPEQVG